MSFKNIPTFLLLVFAFLLTACEPTDTDIHNTIKNHLIKANNKGIETSTLQGNRATQKIHITTEKVSCEKYGTSGDYVCNADATVKLDNGKIEEQRIFLRFKEQENRWVGRVLSNTAAEVNHCHQTCSLSD